MHTYRKINGNEYQVGYYTMIGEEGVGVSDEFQLIRRFKNELRAITFTNYLNGGNQDIALIKEILEAEDSGIDAIPAN